VVVGDGGGGLLLLLLLLGLRGGGGGVDTRGRGRRRLRRVGQREIWSGEWHLATGSRSVAEKRVCDLKAVGRLARMVGVVMAGGPVCARRL
jgi:hypothetical protein